MIHTYIIYIIMFIVHWDQMLTLGKRGDLRFGRTTLCKNWRYNIRNQVNYCHFSRLKWLIISLNQQQDWNYFKRLNLDSNLITLNSRLQLNPLDSAFELLSSLSAAATHSSCTKAASMSVNYSTVGIGWYSWRDGYYWSSGVEQWISLEKWNKSGDAARTTFIRWLLLG